MSTTMRVKYTKEGVLRWLSHLEVARVLRRGLRRGGIETSYSQGFNPHERLSLGPPTPVGMASLAEYCDVGLTGEQDEQGFVTALNAVLPVGMRVLWASLLPEGRPSLGKTIKRCLYRIDCSAWHVDGETLRGALDSLLELTSLEASSKSGSRQIAIAGDVTAAVEDDGVAGTFRCTLRHDVKVALIIGWLAEKTGADPKDALVTRLEQMADDGEPIGPLAERL